jgi:PKD repeat protein
MKRQTLLIASVLFIFAGAGCYKKEAIPVANFTILNSNGSIIPDTLNTVPDTLTFNNLSQNASSYKWDFGDNNTSTGTSPVHIYTIAGAYTITLKAYSKSGEQWAIKTNSIIIK